VFMGESVAFTGMNEATHTNLYTVNIYAIE
jgi:hypothetical protein